jgi:hypothetical protein
MMRIDGLGSELSGFFSEEPHELWKIDTGGAAFETTTAG